MLSAWRFVTVFGTISLLADFVYEGARSITGPLLASLGATGLVVGVVTGIGEAAALGVAAGVGAADRPHPTVLGVDHRGLRLDRHHRARPGHRRNACGWHARW